LHPDRDFWHGRLVCVTGGTGFLGFHLVRTLCGLGARVRVFALDPPPEHPVRQLANATVVAGDVLDFDSVRRTIAGCSIVMHAAGNVAVCGPALQKMWAVHVEGTRNVLAALAPGARLVHTSSVVAVGTSRTVAVLDEDAPFNLSEEKLPYIHAKRAAEQLAKESTKDVVIANPGYLIGPDDHARSVMGELCHRFWRGRAPIAPPGGLNCVDVRDAAVGHLLAAERGAAGRRYILGGENLDYLALMRMLAEIAGFRPRLLPRIPLPVFTAAAALNEARARLFSGRAPYPALAHARLNRHTWYFSSERARVELGYEPRPSRESLADAYVWFQTRKRFRVRGINRWLLRPDKVAPVG
jgi:dihydroflavonol-4-reductase